MRERHERVYGPTKHYQRWRVVIVGIGGEDQRSYLSFETEAEAEAAVRRARAEISTRTIDATVAEYLVMLDGRAREGELQASTVERITYHLRKALDLAAHGHKDLCQLTPALGEQLYDRRKGAVDSHRNGLAVCKSFGRWCVKRGHLKVSPFAEVKGAGRRKKGKPQLGLDEAKTFMDACLALGPKDDGAGLALSYLLLGARSGEMIDRQVRDLDDGGRVLVIRTSKTNAGKRRIEVPPVLIPFLLRLAQGRPRDALLFAHVATRARPADWAREQVRRICQLAGVPRMTPQALRGTQATIASEAGSTAQQVAAQLGHAQAAPAVTTSGAYVHPERASAARRRVALRVLTGGKR